MKLSLPTEAICMTLPLGDAFPSQAYVPCSPFHLPNKLMHSNLCLRVFLGYRVLRPLPETPALMELEFWLRLAWPFNLLSLAGLCGDFLGRGSPTGSEPSPQFSTALTVYSRSTSGHSANSSLPFPSPAHLHCSLLPG